MAKTVKKRRASTKPGRPTVQDVAREAGVSTATVSRALTRPNDVKEATRKHIEDVVARIGYRANRAAAELRQGRSKTLLVLVSDITNAFYAEFFKGIEEHARSRGYAILIGDTSEDASSERVYSDMLLMNQAGGLILNTYGFPEDLMPPEGEHEYSGPPLVSCSGHKTMGLPSVRIDDRLGGEMVGRHLVELGHRDFFQICGPLYVDGFERRFFGFSQALKHVGIRPDDTNHIAGDLSTEFGREAARAILARKERPTAIFVHNDETAIGVLHEFSRQGIRVPDDISVVGYDDMPYAAAFQPELTTVRLPRREWGARACDMLINVVENTPEHQRLDIVEPELIIRQSTAAPSPRQFAKENR